MANRTLRRAYGGTRESTGELSGIIEGDVGSSPERSVGESDADNVPVGDGTVVESDIERDSGGIGVVEIDPAELDDYIAGDAADSRTDSGTGKRPRKKRGPNKRTAGRKAAQDSIAPFLEMAHTWAAVFLKTPEIALAPAEAAKLSDAYTEFCAYHDVPVLGAKRMSEINMILALGMVYGPRVVAVRNRIKEQARVNKAKNVTPISQAN